jgi:hypothetical protein
MAETQKRSRALLPLLWWLLLVAVLFAIHTHQRLLEETRLYFSISLKGQPLPYLVAVTMDGKPVVSGEKISLGHHRFAVTGPKTTSFTRELSIWYGRHDLGDIALARSTGTLSVKADPVPLLIAISGQEFSTNLQDSSGAELILPADQYTISAQYQSWSDSRTVSLTEGSLMPVTFSPKFSSISLSCNRDGATFQLQSDSGQIQESGNLPATVNELPAGNYQARIYYHGQTMERSLLVHASTTNDTPFDFELGAARLETTPRGAEVHSEDGNYLGQTPLLVLDLKPQAVQFSLSMSGYEPVSVSMNVVADQTNSYSTNLVSVGYFSAIHDARTYLATANFEAATHAAVAALNTKPGDADALAIQGEAGKHLDAERLEQERLLRPKKYFDALCSEYTAADLFAEHRLDASKPASDIASDIVTALTNSPNAFKIIKASSPAVETYEIVAQQTGFLHATKRDCLIVIGNPGDGDTEIRFKVLEFEVQHHLGADDQLIPMGRSKVENNSLLLFQVKQGLQMVTDKIRQSLTKHVDSQER